MTVARVTMSSKRWATSLSAQEVEDLQRSTWEIDCPQMLLRSRSSRNRAYFSGSGSIKQTADRQLVFKLYANRQRYPGDSTGDNLPKAGTVIPEEEFFDLTVTDYGGRRWGSKRLLPARIHWTASGKGIVEGSLNELSCKGRYPRTIRLKGSDLSLLVFGSIKFPRNETTRRKTSIGRGRPSSAVTRNVWKFRCFRIDFTLVQEHDSLLRIDAFSKDTKFTPHFKDRVAEALQFVLGRPIPWSVSQQRIDSATEINIRSRQSIDLHGDHNPPLPPESIPDPDTKSLTTKYHQRLFEQYLRHVIEYEKAHHPLWAQINAVYEASNARFIDAHALTLTVAIESLLGQEFANLGRPNQKDLRAIRRAQAYFANWNGKEPIKSRISGSISQLLQSRAGDKLRALIKLGAITDEQLSDWRRLRNISTHSYQSASLPGEKMYDLLRNVEILFYHLIFYAIGYKGPYMDFSTPGWPIKQYMPSRRNRA